MSENKQNLNNQSPKKQATIVIQTPNTRRSVICLENPNETPDYNESFASYNQKSPTNSAASKPNLITKNN